MATEEEIYRIIAQVQGEEDLRRLAAQAEKGEAEIRRLTVELNRNAISQNQFAAAARKAGAAVAQAHAQIAKAEKAGAGRGGRGAGGGGGGKGQRLQIIAQGLDDLQYVGEQGLRPILNNLIQLSPLVGIVGLGLQQLATHWTDIAKAFNLPGGTKTQVEQLEELAKKLGKTTFEVERLNRAETLRDAMKAQAGGRSEGQQEQAEGVNRAVADAATMALSGRENVAGSLAVLNRDRYAAQDPKIRQLQARIDDLEVFGGKKAKPTIDRLNSEIDGRVMDVARRDLANAAIEPARLESMIKQMNENPELFDRKTREAFEAARPGTARADARSMQDLEGEFASEETDKFLRDLRKSERQKRATEAMAGMDAQFRPAILANVARGHLNDPEALAAGVGRQMRSQGRSEDDIAKLSPEIARMLLKSIEGEVRDRSGSDKVDSRTAAERELRDAAEEGRGRARMPSTRMGDLGSFAANLQQGILSADPMEAEALKEARLQSKWLEKLYTETVKVRGRPGTAAAAAIGPA